MRRVWAFVTLVLAVLIFSAWASDFITMQGERTIYTVECRDGSWTADHCSGTVVAGNRYRYRALKPHNEVIFWTVGSAERSGKFDDCAILDGRNWACKPGGDTARSITLAMANGAPVRSPLTRPFRAVSKWRWLLLARGFSSDKPVPMPVTAAASAATG